MPEGDTVYLTARRLHESLADKQLRAAELRHPELSTVDLSGCMVHEVVPIGKHLMLRLRDGRTLHSHLRMDGSWQLYRHGARWNRAAHHARVVLQTDTRIAVGFRLHDLRLLSTSDEHQLVGHLGPDLLAEEYGPCSEAEILRRLRTASGTELGPALLDQRNLAGVGNLYHNETCFLAGLDPYSTVDLLTDDELLRTVRIARNLLYRNRLRSAQSTTGETRPGHEHWVYLRADKPCRRCGTHVRSGEQGNGIYRRTTWWCPRCQPPPPDRR